MKKISVLFLTAIMVISLVACGSNDVKSSIETTDLLGVWYDVKTAQRIEFNSDLSFGHYQTRTAPGNPGYWSIDNNKLNIKSCVTIEDLKIQDFDDSISLNDDIYTFVKWESLPITELSVGEVAKDESVAIKLKDINFYDKLPNEILNSHTYSSSLSGLNSGNVYIKITFDVTNLLKSEINVPGLRGDMDIIVDYDNGFRYATYDNGCCFYISDSDVYITEPGGARGYDISVQPLQTRTFDVYIECPEIISIDDDSPLNICFISKYGTEAKYYSFSIR